MQEGWKLVGYATDIQKRVEHLRTTGWSLQWGRVKSTFTLSLTMTSKSSTMPRNTWNKALRFIQYAMIRLCNYCVKIPKYLLKLQRTLTYQKSRHHKRADNSRMVKGSLWQDREAPSEWFISGGVSHNMRKGWRLDIGKIQQRILGGIGYSHRG